MANAKTGHRREKSVQNGTAAHQDGRAQVWLVVVLTLVLVAIAIWVLAMIIL